MLIFQNWRYFMFSLISGYLSSFYFYRWEFWNSHIADAPAGIFIYLENLRKLFFPFLFLPFFFIKVFFITPHLAALILVCLMVLKELRKFIINSEIIKISFMFIVFWILITSSHLIWVFSLVLKTSLNFTIILIVKFISFYSL